MQQFSPSYPERLFYYFKRLFILLCIVQLICVIVLNEDTILTYIFFILLGIILVLSFTLEHLNRKTFPIVEILSNTVRVRVGNEDFFFDLNNDSCEVYCHVNFSVNGFPLSYDKGISFGGQEHQIKIYLDKLSVNKVLNIKSQIEHFKAEPSPVLLANTDIIDRPTIVISNKALRPVIFGCIAVIFAFWGFIAFLVIQQEVDIPNLLLCTSLSFITNAILILANRNSLIRIKYKEKLILTTFLGKKVELSPQDISTIDMKRVNNSIENLIHYIDIELKDHKHLKYKISLNSDEKKNNFLELSKYLEHDIYKNNRTAIVIR